MSRDSNTRTKEYGNGKASGPSTQSRLMARPTLRPYNFAPLRLFGKFLRVGEQTTRQLPQKAQRRKAEFASKESDSFHQLFHLRSNVSHLSPPGPHPGVSDSTPKYLPNESLANDHEVTSCPSPNRRWPPSLAVWAQRQPPAEY